MKKGYLYILECSDGTLYTGSTIDLDKRMLEHQEGRGANHTRKRLPIRLVYYKEFATIGEAFRKEKQIQGWSRNKKKALIKENFVELKNLAECQNESHHKWFRLRSTTESDLNE